MGESQGDHDRLQTILVGPSDGLRDLFTPALLDFRGADRARPHVAASHQAGVEATAILAGRMHAHGAGHGDPFALGCAVPVVRVFEAFALALEEEQRTSRSQQFIPGRPVALQLLANIGGGSRFRVLPECRPGGAPTCGFNACYWCI
ncbi:hypothetical protein D3C75_1051070 [compost metagenome]